jgi:hypothetical protein
VANEEETRRRQERRVAIQHALEKDEAVPLTWTKSGGLRERLREARESSEAQAELLDGAIAWLERKWGSARTPPESRAAATSSVIAASCR